MQTEDVTALMRVVERPPQVFVSGSGSWLADQNERRYLDFVQGWALNVADGEIDAMIGILDSLLQS